MLALPGWYRRVYPVRRPLLLTGGPQFRVRESKPGLITVRKEGGPGTKKKVIVYKKCYNLAFIPLRKI